MASRRGTRSGSPSPAPARSTTSTPIDVTRGRLERWTFSEMGGANPETLPDAEIVKWKSFDGLEISGVLYRPPASFTGPRPVIINVHGGPVERERPRAIGRSNYFRNELGIAVIYPNIRGLVRLRPLVRAARQRPAARERGQGHRRAARLDRERSPASTRTGS